MRASPHLELLEAHMQYRFQNRALLQEALTHPSVRFEKRHAKTDNQRLEFLGDAVLQLTLSEALFHRLPDRDEGMLTKLRTRLVSERALAKMARNLGLGEFIGLGKSAEANGARLRDSTLSDALEAVMGAIYLDGSFKAAQEFILRVAGTELKAVMDRPVDVNPKGDLQELLQGTLGSAPTYEVIQEEGPAHERIFQVVASWGSTELGRGRGSSKKTAEAEAARIALASSALQSLLRHSTQKSAKPAPERL